MTSSWIEIERKNIETSIARAAQVEADEVARLMQQEIDAKPVIDALREVDGDRYGRSGIATNRGGSVWDAVLDGNFTSVQLDAARRWLIRNHSTDTRIMRSAEGATPKY